MKSLFDQSRCDEVKSRLARLTPDMPRQWGRMNAAQAMAHCAIALETAVGDSNPPRVFVGYIIGPLVRRLALGNDAPMKRNSPTAPSFVVSTPHELDAERTRVASLVDRFFAGGRAGCTTHPHVFFGRMSLEEWGVLMYKHLDHHLRQFGV